MIEGPQLAIVCILGIILYLGSPRSSKLSPDQAQRLNIKR